MSNLHSAREEILTLRLILRHTRRALRKGTIDPVKATRIITQTTRTLASLPPAPPAPPRLLHPSTRPHELLLRQSNLRSPQPPSGTPRSLTPPTTDYRLPTTDY